MTVGEIKNMIKGCADEEQLILLLENGKDGTTEWTRINNIAVDKYVSIKECIQVLDAFCGTQKMGCENCPLQEKACCHIAIICDELENDVLNFNYKVR